MKEEVLKKEITELREENKELRMQMEFYKSALDVLQNPIFLKDEDLRYVFFNQSYKDSFGLTDGQYIGSKVEDLDYLPKKEKLKYQEDAEKVIVDRSVVCYETFFDNPKEGIKESLYWSKGFQSDVTGQRGVIGEIVDISKEKRLQRDLERYIRAFELCREKTEQISKIDPVTNLFNRHIFAEEVRDILESAKTEGMDLCALMTDIDDFKSVNDTYGHAAGDEMLLSFANVMKSSFRQSDVLIRYGGDEFIVILVGMSIDQAQPVAQRFLDNVRRQVKLPNKKAVTASVGVSQMEPDDELMDFISRTDEALYEARVFGKNRVVISNDRKG